MMNANNTANISPILHNNHIINNNHQHLHQTNMNFGGQMLSNDIQNATYYQQQHPFMQHQRNGENMIINNTMSASGTNGLSHIKNRNRLMKNNGLNNNFYRSSGTNKQTTFSRSLCNPFFRFCLLASPFLARIFYDFDFGAVFPHRFKRGINERNDFSRGSFSTFLHTPITLVIVGDFCFCSISWQFRLFHYLSRWRCDISMAFFDEREFSVSVASQQLSPWWCT